MKNKKFIYTVALFFLLLDQVIKFIITNNMALMEEITIIPKFFSIYYLKNIGATFSIMGNRTLFLIMIAIVCLIVLKYYIKSLKQVNTLTIISLGMMIGGIVGNLFDRILYQSVIDYLAFTFGKYNFPVFNLADIGITVGAVLVIINLIKEEIDTKKSTTQN